MKDVALNFGDKNQVEQHFRGFGGRVRRTVATSSGPRSCSVKLTRRLGNSAKNFFASALDGPVSYECPKFETVRYVDLFSGGGGLSLGVSEALRFFGYDPKCALAADIDSNALKLVDDHFNPSIVYAGNIEDLVEHQIDYSGESKQYIREPEIIHPELAAYFGKVDLVVGGPPCQGHSNLNNRTRRKDRRNLLYFLVPSIGIALGASKIIIENVRTILRSEERVVQITRQLLQSHGYEVQEEILDASDFGVAQRRERHFLLAKKTGKFDFRSVKDNLSVDKLSFENVNLNLRPNSRLTTELESQPRLSDLNRRRIDYLHENDIDDLPNLERPECHRNGHTYPSVYGRIRLNEPAQTITTGYGSPGRGRFVHPTERRVMTHREAARLQGFPDWYWQKESVTQLERGHIQKIIGDAVPPHMVFPLICSLFE